MSSDVAPRLEVWRDDVLVREQFDDRVRVSPDIGSVIDGPLLGELPQDADVKKGEVTLALVQAPMSPLSESIRDLRTPLAG